MTPRVAILRQAEMLVGGLKTAHQKMNLLALVAHADDFSAHYEIQTLANVILNMDEAWRAFCPQVGFDANAVLLDIPGGPDVQAYVSAARQIQPNEEERNARRNLTMETLVTLMRATYDNLLSEKP